VTDRASTDSRPARWSRGGRRVAGATLALGALLVLSACGSATAESAAPSGVPSTLKVGLIPNIAPEEQKAKYAALGTYLGTALGTEVELFVASDYAGVVAALASGRIDVAYLGGLTFVQADQQVALEPLVTEIDALTSTPQYDSAIVVATDSPITKTSDLLAAGGSFAFGDVASTSGSLYPRAMLVEAGATCDPVTLTDCPPLAKVTFTGGHDATAQAVLSGAVDAGGLEYRILKRLEKEGKVPAGALRVIETRRVQGYPWVGRDALGTETLDAVTQAFLDIDDPALLDLLRATSYVEVDDADYAEVRDLATRLGLISPS
jgi:phosphonate transport system substrate-binding protein